MASDLPNYTRLRVRPEDRNTLGSAARQRGPNRNDSLSGQHLNHAENRNVAFNFIEGYFGRLGIQIQRRTGSSFIPSFLNQSVRLPDTYSGLLQTMDDLMELYQGYLLMTQAPDAELAPEPEDAADLDTFGVDMEEQEVFTFNVTVTSYNQQGMTVTNIYVLDGSPEDFQVLSDATLPPAVRIARYYLVADTNADERYEQGFVDIDAIVEATEQDGSGLPREPPQPAPLPDSQAGRFSDPMRRLSWDSSAVLVDHPGIRYDPTLLLARSTGQPIDRTFTPKDPYLRHNYIPNLCWFNAIIDLVNTRMKRPWMTYDKLWINYLQRPGCFSPEEASHGMCIEDVIPVFDHLDRQVTVFDGMGTVVYSRTRTTRKYNHIVPHHWVFFMTEEHIYHVNPNAPHDDLTEVRRRLRYAPTHGAYEELLEDYPYETLSPFFPSKERSPPRILQPHTKKTKEQCVLFLQKDPSVDADDCATMEEILFAPDRFQDCDITVLVQADMLTHVLKPLVHKYGYRPSIYGTGPSNVNRIIIQSVVGRGVVSFINPVGKGKCNSLDLPVLPALSGPGAGQEEIFIDKALYLEFVKADHAFYQNLVARENLSTMHETTHQVCRSFMRGGLHGWFVPPVVPGMPSITLSSLDMNRVYPSVFKAGWVPVCDVFDRWHTVPPMASGEDAHCFLHSELEDSNLCFVYVYDTPTCYMERGSALCFQANLVEFLKRPGVVLLGSSMNPSHASGPSGHTYVKVMAYLPCRKRAVNIWEHVIQIWSNERLPRWCRKKALLRSLGKLGRSCNTSFREASIFLNEQEAYDCSQRGNGRMANIDDTIYLSFRDGDRVPRLEGGYLMHLFVLDSYRLALQQAYDRLTAAGVQPLYCRGDEFFFHSDEMSLARGLVFQGDSECVNAFGRLKVGHEETVYDPSGFNGGIGYFSSCNLMSGFLHPGSEAMFGFQEEIADMERAHRKTTVAPLPNEFQIDNIENHRRLLLRANVPGAGKSHSVLSRYAKDTLVICPTNALCVAFIQKYPGVQAMTLHKFLRINVDMESNDRSSSSEHDPTTLGSIIAFREKQPEFNKVLLLDEIYMYPMALLNKLYFRLSTTSACRVYATGDPNQLPPVHEASGESLNDITDEKARRMDAVNLLFPKQMELRVCKRAFNAQDNELMSSLCLRMRNPGFTMPMVRDLIKNNFTQVLGSQTIEWMRSDPTKFISVCYYNATCHRIARSVLPGGSKLHPGVVLVNRKRQCCRGGGIMMVNYEYEFIESEGYSDCTVECVMTKVRYKVSKAFVEKNMHWSQTRTCHSLQGSSVDGALILWDLESPHITPEFIYVAMTRARSLKEVYYVVA